MKTAEDFLKEHIDKFNAEHKGFESFEETKEMYPKLIEALVASHVAYATQAIGECAKPFDLSKINPVIKSTILSVKDKLK